MGIDLLAYLSSKFGQIARVSIGGRAKLRAGYAGSRGLDRRVRRGLLVDVGMLANQWHWLPLRWPGLLCGAVFPPGVIAAAVGVVVKGGDIFSPVHSYLNVTPLMRVASIVMRQRRRNSNPHSRHI